MEMLEQVTTNESKILFIAFKSSIDVKFEVSKHTVCNVPRTVRLFVESGSRFQDSLPDSSLRRSIVFHFLQIMDCNRNKHNHNDFFDIQK